MKMSIDRVIGLQTVPDDSNKDQDGIDEKADNPDETLMPLP